MTDLYDRLDRLVDDDPIALRDVAWAEIQRLTGERDKAQAWADHVTQEGLELVAEVERLRRANEAMRPVVAAAVVFVTEDDPTSAQIDALAKAVDVMPWDAYRPAGAAQPAGRREATP